MTFDKFVEGFKKSTKPADYVKKHVKVSYIPYERKISEARKIIELSNYVTIQDKKVYKQNSTLAYMLFVMRVLANYTDIEWELGKDDLAAFNALSECGAVEFVVAAIPSKEYETFQTVVKMVQDDEYENYRSLAGFFDSKVDALSIMFDELSKVVEANKAESQ